MKNIWCSQDHNEQHFTRRLPLNSPTGRYCGQFRQRGLFCCHFQNWNTRYLLTLIPKTTVSFLTLWLLHCGKKDSIICCLSFILETVCVWEEICCAAPIHAQCICPLYLLINVFIYTHLFWYFELLEECYKLLFKILLVLNEKKNNMSTKFSLKSKVKIVSRPALFNNSY